jgi:hypothetical protein
MWPSRGRVLPRGGPRPSDLQRAPAYPVTPDRPKVSLEVMNIDGMTLCEREARGERAQSRRSALTWAGSRSRPRTGRSGSSARMNRWAWSLVSLGRPGLARCLIPVAGLWLQPAAARQLRQVVLRPSGHVAHAGRGPSGVRFARALRSASSVAALGDGHGVVGSSAAGRGGHASA